MKDHMPAVSVIVPAYNVEAYLSECIDSLLDQQITIEIILINDGSTDSSGNIADSYQRRDTRIKVVHQSNQGLPAARNKGLTIAKGEYIVFIDSDDRIEKNSLVELYQKAKNNQAEMIMGRIEFCYSDGKIYNPFELITSENRNRCPDGKQWFQQLLSSGIYYLMVCNYMYKRDWLINESLSFDPVIHEDELWTPVALSKAKRVFISDIPFYNYRQREDSIMHTLNKNKRIESLVYIANKLFVYSQEYKFDNDDKIFKSWLFVDIFRLYSIVFELISRIRDTSFFLPEHYLNDFDQINGKLDPIAQESCLYYYQKGIKGLKQYSEWLTSPWVSLRKKSNLKDKKLILVFNTMWGEDLHVSPEQIPSECIITTDRKYFSRADSVIFHLPDLYQELENDLDKPDGQIWVAWYLECEENYLFMKDSQFMDLFDLRMSYHQHADVVYPYYQYEYQTSLFQPSSYNKQDKACMFISSAINNSKRIEYLNELIQYTEIDSYGSLMNNKQIHNDEGRKTKMEILSSYKFTIAFENAIGNDYVTEKFYDPLLMGSVPVYLGAPNINDFTPGNNCFVDATQFENPRALASFMNNCYRDESLYKKLFNWKEKPLSQTFIDKVEEQHINPFVKLCHKIRERIEEEQLISARVKDLGNIYLCSFGDSRYLRSRERLISQASSFGIFQDIFIYNEHELGNSFTKEFKTYLQPGSRGYGYWVWKPYIILESLKKIKENDILLYLDMGCHLNSKGKKRFLDYWSLSRKNESGFVVIDLEPEKIERKWTKRDILEYFGVTNDLLITDTPQLQAGIIFIRKNQKTVHLIQEWMNIYHSHFHLIDDSPSVLPNLADFQECRHDQSLLSVLLKIHGTSVISVDETYHADWEVLVNKYPLLAKRDLC